MRWRKEPLLDRQKHQNCLVGIVKSPVALSGALRACYILLGLALAGALAKVNIC